MLRKVDSLTCWAIVRCKASSEAVASVGVTPRKAMVGAYCKPVPWALVLSFGSRMKKVRALVTWMFEDWQSMLQGRSSSHFGRSQNGESPDAPVACSSRPASSFRCPRGDLVVWMLCCYGDACQCTGVGAQDASIRKIPKFHSHRQTSTRSLDR
jgi:hypothetical protein